MKLKALDGKDAVFPLKMNERYATIVDANGNNIVNEHEGYGLADDETINWIIDACNAHAAELEKPDEAPKD